mgnify:CR=1 FL=1
MFNDEYIKFLESNSKFNINDEEKKYIILKFNNMIKTCDKLSNLPKIEKIFFNNIEDEIIY